MYNSTYIHTITPFVLLLLLVLVVGLVVFSTTKNQNLPLLFLATKAKKKRKAKKRVQPNSIFVTAPGLPLYLFRSHSLPFWEVAQVQYIYTYYDSRKNLHVDSLLPG